MNGSKKKNEGKTCKREWLQWRRWYANDMIGTVRRKRDENDEWWLYEYHFPLDG